MGAGSLARQTRRTRRDRAARRAAKDEAPSSAKLSEVAREWGKTLLLTVVFLVLIRAFLVQTFVIVSGSMEDTLLVGDFLMVNRLALGTHIPGTDLRTPGYSEPHRGDVLVFDPPHEEGIKLVKRLIGMPGDTLEMRDGTLFINGEPQREPYTKWEDEAGDQHAPEMLWQRAFLLPGAPSSAARPTRDIWGPLLVPESHYFMLGDNRAASQDSRYWGFIERWRMEGRAMFFYFSYDARSMAPFAFLREIRWDRIGQAID